jgi:hypothetical protein
MRLLAARKRRRLDREMDDAFRDTMESAKDGWRVMAGLEHDHGEGAGGGMGMGRGMQRTPSITSVASDSYSQPPLAVAPQASYYNYGYEPTYAPEPAYAPAPMMGPPMGMGQGQMQMAQHAYPAQTYAQAGLARGPSQSAVVELHRPGGGDYLSNYTAQPVLPNPFDGGERAMTEVPLSPGAPKVLKVCYALLLFFGEEADLSGFCRLRTSSE